MRKSFKKLLRKSKKDLVFMFVAGLFVVLGAGLLWFSSLQIPDIASFNQRVLGQSTKIYDRTGAVLLYDLSQNMRRTVVPFDKMAPYLKQAAIVIEDEDFYKHGGIKISNTAPVRSYILVDC